MSAAAADAVRSELQLDRPVLVSLGAWWGSLLRLDLGVSLVTGEPVLHEIEHQLGFSLGLALTAMALSILIGLPLGMVAGLWPSGLADRLTRIAAVLLRAVPPFIVGLVLIITFSVALPVLPAAGHGETGSVFLPAVTLAIGLAAASWRVTRDSMVAVRQSEFYQFALTKGLSLRDALTYHGLRNAAVPVVAYLGVQLAFLVEGMIVVETLFAWPGIGHALAHAIFGRDIPMIQGTALVMGLLFVFLNAWVDVACLALDPRRRAIRRAA